jgi:pimeloyl-ACP methyl ester carboxylesterase
MPVLPSTAPTTRYARSGEFHVAYQTVGTGAPDVVFVPSFWSHVEAHWEQPLVARFLLRLASFGRLIVFDKRGAGLSDPVAMSSPPTLEEWMDDLRAMLDAVGSRRAVVMAHSGGCHMSMLFAATYPERVSHLVLLEAYPRLLAAPDYPVGVPEAWLDALAHMVRETWGTGAMLPASAPSLADDIGVREWFARYERLSASPGAALATLKATGYVDIRAILPSIQAPTLLLTRIDNAVVPVGHSRYLVQHIPHARLVELPGFDHAFLPGTSTVSWMRPNGSSRAASRSRPQTACSRRSSSWTSSSPHVALPPSVTRDGSARWRNTTGRWRACSDATPAGW